MEFCIISRCINRIDLKYSFCPSAIEWINCFEDNCFADRFLQTNVFWQGMGSKTSFQYKYIVDWIPITLLMYGRKITERERGENFVYVVRGWKKNFKREKERWRDDYVLNHGTSVNHLKLKQLMQKAQKYRTDNRWFFDDWVTLELKIKMKLNAKLLIQWL